MSHVQINSFHGNITSFEYLSNKLKCFFCKLSNLAKIKIKNMHCLIKLKPNQFTGNQIFHHFAAIP